MRCPMKTPREQVVAGNGPEIRNPLQYHANGEASDKGEQVPDFSPHIPSLDPVRALPLPLFFFSPFACRPAAARARCTSGGWTWPCSMSC